MSAADAGFSPDSDSTRRWFRLPFVVHTGIRHAAERARTEAQVHAGIERDVTPQPIGVAAQIAGRRAPVRADLLLDA